MEKERKCKDHDNRHVIAFIDVIKSAYEKGTTVPLYKPGICRREIKLKLMSIYT
ncbi:MULTISPECIES: hypothetical protein [Bacillaceae]|uniref:hypothetical protein n=1 Tax=Bacillaceae TaxID=186817 RepID=UPI0015E30DCB|nr:MULTISPECIES: hypothetical protein [Bacillaceae]